MGGVGRVRWKERGHRERGKREREKPNKVRITFQWRVELFVYCLYVCVCVCVTERQTPTMLISAEFHEGPVIRCSKSSA